MIPLDANLLVDAHVIQFTPHNEARSWLDDRLSDVLPVGFRWTSVLAFLRLVTNPRVFERPEPVERAWHQVEAWLNCAVVWIPQPTDRHRAVLDKLLGSHGVRASPVPDAQLAALAIERGLIAVFG